MATEEQLDELARATGADADDLFVELMTAHHQGGIDMAEEAAERATTTTSSAAAAWGAISSRRSSSSKGSLSTWLVSLVTLRHTSDGRARPSRTLPPMTPRPALAATIAASCSCSARPALARRLSAVPAATRTRRARRRYPGAAVDHSAGPTTAPATPTTSATTTPLDEPGASTGGAEPTDRRGRRRR